MVKESTAAAGLVAMTDASVIVCGELKTPASKTIVSALPAAAFASKTACRRLPAPLLLVFVTVKVAAVAVVEAPTKMKRKSHVILEKQILINCIFYSSSNN